MSSIGNDVRVGKLTVLEKVAFQTDTELDASRVLVKDRFELAEGCEIVGLNDTYATDQELAAAEAHLQSNIVDLQEKTDGLTSNLATEKTRIDGLVSSLSTTDAQVVNLNTTLGASVTALRTDVDSNSAILSSVASNLASLEAQTDLLAELNAAFDPNDPNQGTAIATLTAGTAGLAGSIYSSILTRGVASTQGQIVDILEDQFGDTLDNLSNVSNVNNKATSDIAGLQDVVNLQNWGTVPGSGTNYDYVITSPGDIGKNLTSNVIRFNHELYGANGNVAQIKSNITGIKSNLYTHDVLIGLNSNNLAQNAITINNLSSNYTALNSSVAGAVATLATLTSSGGTIDTIQTDLSSNVTRIEALESNISSVSGSNVTYTTVESNLATSTNVYIGDNLTMGEMYTTGRSGGAVTQLTPNATLHIHGQSRGLENISLGAQGATLSDAHIMLTDTEYDPSEAYDATGADPNQVHQDFDGGRMYLWTKYTGTGTISSIQSASASYSSSGSLSNVATREVDFKTDFTEQPGFLALNPKGGNIGIGTASPGYTLHVHKSGATWPDFVVRPTSLWGDGLTTASETGGTQYMTVGKTMFQGPHITPNAVGGDAYIRYGRAGGVQSGVWWETAARTDGSFHIAKNGSVGSGVHINSDGTVRVGTSLNGFYAGKFSVYGTSGAVGPVSYFNRVGGNLYSGNASLGSVSIYANYGIAAGDYIAASDRRIKDNITDVDDGSALETLRLLKPKRYTYRDTIHKGEEPVWGFIAQEVRDTLPYATTLIKDTVPNIYELANVSSSNVITFTDFNTSNLEANATTIRVMTKEDKTENVTLAEVIDEHSIRVEEDLADWTGSLDESGNVVAGNQLFIYGQEVDDFVFLKKDAIWTVATSALQEVDRQLQAEKAKVTALEARLSALEALVQQP